MASTGKVTGIVKWFSSNQEHGLITDEKKLDYFFLARDIINELLPIAGTKVLFIPIKTPAGLRAKIIEIK